MATRDGLHDLLRSVGDLNETEVARAGRRRRRCGRDAVGAGGGAASRAGEGRRRAALDRRGRRGPVPRRARGRAAGRAARGVPGRCARRAAAGGSAVRGDARAIHERCRCASATGVDAGAVAEPVGARRRPCARRAAPRRLRARVVPPRGAAAAAAGIAGGVAARGRAGRPARRWRDSCPPGRVSIAGRADRLDRAPGSTVCGMCWSPYRGWRYPAEVWEREVLPRRTRRLLDRVDGPALRRGRGRLDRRRSARALGQGRAVLPRRPGVARAAVAVRGGAAVGADASAQPAQAAIRERLERGACFFADLLVELEDVPAEEVQSALWDLVWAGEVTNDAFAPLRAGRLTLARAAAVSGRRTVGRARPGRFAGRARGGGAVQVQGRWSLTAPLLGTGVDATARRRALAELLLERYGILTREQVLAEGVAGGFSAIYSELTQLETLGVARRGYFVEGLGGAQFALPGAVERLRERRPLDEPPIVLSAVDPAQPYGAALAWPPGLERAPARRAGALVVLACGEPALYLERGGRALQTLLPAGDERLRASLAALVEHVRSRSRWRSAIGAGEGRRRPAAWLRRSVRAARARLPGGTAAVDAQCLRATRSYGRRRGCARCWSARCPTRSRRRIRDI